jgi:hypothetical protein
MKNYQQASASELQRMLEQRNYWMRIHNNKLLCKTQASVPSKIINGGISKILTYYDEHIKYLCTIHQVTTRDGKIIHEDVKDAFLDGTRYKAKR